MINQKRQSPENNFKNVLGWILAIKIALLIGLFVMGNIVTCTCIVGSSMEPNFKCHDHILLNRIYYRFNKPKRGDVIVINQSRCENGLLYNMIEKTKDIEDGLKYGLNICDELSRDNLLKRIVAVEGDIIDIKNGKLYINGQIKIENIVKGNTYKDPHNKYPILIPRDKVFVLGDNRENSLDSRIFGLVNKYAIKGRVKTKIIPYKSIAEYN